ncbi:glutathione S-transferase family protein, partial [Salmonella sp. s55004]|uniref:glutathione S-transferase family protein n=1 Tax=Salmonella sp. s55004 TaxID=3159675 RepID=UPI003980F99E
MNIINNKMPSYKLLYFNVKARGEPIRFLFAIAGVTYEDKRVNGEEWGKIKPTTTLGQLPILYVDGKEVPQSRAINRLVARDLGLYGSNTWEQALIDVVCETVDEVWPAVAGIFMEKDEAKKDELRKKF